jgi:hypothetical protein
VTGEELTADPAVPTPIVFCPAKTASPGELLPRANRTSCAAN